MTISTVERENLVSSLGKIAEEHRVRYINIREFENEDIYRELSNEEKDKILRIGAILGITSSLKQKLETDLQNAYETNFDKFKEVRNIGVIAQSARIDYITQSRKNILFMIMVTILYAIAIYLVLKIAWHQSQVIFGATGASVEKMFLY